MLFIVVLFFVLLIVLLAIPITLTWQTAGQQELNGEIRFIWLFGLVRFQRPWHRGKVRSKKHEKRKIKSSSKRNKKPTMTKNLISVIRNQDSRRRIYRFISDCWNAVQKRNINLSMRIGLGDPADTGCLWAVFGPVQGMLASIEGASIKLEPEFFDETFELDSSGQVRIVPLQIIYLIGGLILSPGIWRSVVQ